MSFQHHSPRRDSLGRGWLQKETGKSYAININNNLSVTGVVNGIPVFSSLGAAGLSSFTITGTPLAGLGANNNNIRVNNVPCGASCAGASRPLIAIQGTGGTVRIGP